MSPITKKLMLDKGEALNLSSDVSKRDDLLASSTSDNASSNSSSSNYVHGKGSSSSRQYGRVNRIVLDKNSDEYKKRRERNNMAVKKSRNKSKMRTAQTMQRVNELKDENERLETKVKILSKELSFLKDLFLAHAGSTTHSGPMDGNNLYNGSQDAGNANNNNNNNNAPINSNIITSTGGLNSTAVDCNLPGSMPGEMDLAKAYK
ncbi:hypothetical protein TYRP_004633 [Tyrophagus putrescentiae]|nr:hypothetical protein TYRP_004633 [Tyrophagus putrescentiae]